MTHTPLSGQGHECWDGRIRKALLFSKACGGLQKTDSGLAIRRGHFNTPMLRGRREKNIRSPALLRVPPHGEVETVRSIAPPGGAQKQCRSAVIPRLRPCFPWAAIPLGRAPQSLAGEHDSSSDIVLLRMLLRLLLRLSYFHSLWKIGKGLPGRAPGKFISAWPTFFKIATVSKEKRVSLRSDCGALPSGVRIRGKKERHLWDDLVARRLWRLPREFSRSGQSPLPRGRSPERSRETRFFSPKP